MLYVAIMTEDILSYVLSATMSYKGYLSKTN